jgi:hypothetical protein
MRLIEGSDRACPGEWYSRGHAVSESSQRARVDVILCPDWPIVKNRCNPRRR